MNAQTTAAGSTQLPIATASQMRALLLRHVRARPGQVLLAVGLALVAAVASLSGPWFVGRMVDVVVAGGDRNAVLLLAVWLAGAGITGALVTWLSARAIARLGQEWVGGLRQDALQSALALPTETVELSGTGDVLSRVGDDVAIVSGIVTALLAPLVGAALAVGLTVAGLAALDPRLALAGLCAAPVYYFSLRWYLPRAAPRYAKERVMFADRAEVFVSALAGGRTLRAYGAEADFGDRITAASHNARVVSKEVLWFYTGWSKWLNFAELAGLGMILLLGYFLVDGGSLTLGALTTAALFFHRLFNPIGVIVGSFDEMQSAAASLARIAGLAGAAKANPGRAAALAGTAPHGRRGSVVVSGVSHGYGGTRVLNNVSLDIAPGQKVALVGSSGAGKSTLAAVIAGLVDPDAGTVLIGGRPVGPPDEGEAPAVVLVTQDAHVFSGPLAEDLLLARPGASAHDMEQALELVGAAGWVAALPQGRATIIGEQGESLDAERAAQLALARAALANPAVVILDEATAEAGSGGARRLEAAAGAVLAERTGIVVAHRLSQVADCDVVVVLEHGSIVEQGTHPELLARGGRYAELWAAWGK